MAIIKQEVQAMHSGWIEKKSVAKNLFIRVNLRLKLDI